MTRYFLDTNIWLRLFMKDNQARRSLILKYLSSAKAHKIELVVIPEIIMEVECVLRKVYKLPKREIVKHIEIIIQTSYIEIYNRMFLQQSLMLYRQLNIDLVDAYLYYCAKSENAEVLTFDGDFKKISSYH